MPSFGAEALAVSVGSNRLAAIQTRSIIESEITFHRALAIRSSIPILALTSTRVNILMVSDIWILITLILSIVVSVGPRLNSSKYPGKWIINVYSGNSIVKIIVATCTSVTTCVSGVELLAYDVSTVLALLSILGSCASSYFFTGDTVVALVAPALAVTSDSNYVTMNTTVKPSCEVLTEPLRLTIIVLPSHSTETLAISLLPNR